MNPLLLQCANYSQDVYPKGKFEAAIRFPEVIAKFDVVSQKTDTNCRIYVTEKKLFVAIQGTKELIDWKTNFKVAKKKFFDIKAHGGFVEAAQSILNEVYEVLSGYPGVEVNVTGHSLGGAEGFLMAYALQELFKLRGDRRTINLITYGQPKVATTGACRAFYGSYLRVVNGSDAVPRRPNVPGYYSHGGQCIYIPNTEHWVRPIINPSYALRWKDRFMTGAERLTDHSMRDYLRELNKCVILQ